jgi:hypothetical protein
MLAAADRRVLRGGVGWRDRPEAAVATVNSVLSSGMAYEIRTGLPTAVGLVGALVASAASARGIHDFG